MPTVIAGAPREVTSVFQVGDGVGNRPDRLDVDQLVDAAAAAGGVAVGNERGSQVPIPDGERDEAVRSSGDVPGQRPSSARTRCVRFVRVAIEQVAFHRGVRAGGRRSCCVSGQVM